MSLSPIILDGRIVRAEKSAQLVQALQAFSYVPQLAILQVGDRADSVAYIRAKKVFAGQIGAKATHIHLPEDVSQEEVTAHIRECNADQEIQGIIVQLPLPAHLDRHQIIGEIDPRKDVDGLTPTNQSLLAHNSPDAIVPATARGVKELLEYHRIELKGKKVAVVGRSQLVGAPIAHVCAHAGADVIVCHSKTVDLAVETKKADVLIVAVGKPGLIDARHVTVGQIIVDVGINRMPDGSLQGDVDFVAVAGMVSAITPVPGGVGQMTVTALFENLIDACK
ncbi:MAG: bifunctional 5,10-methylenetetrahydrofolate dehydrogenase/5,10-methenyltetrahydrofolate cyclohydrolase [Patescibacteria group bacterium]